MPIILSNNLLTVQLPQPSIMIRARRNQVGRISTECAIPDPALVARQGTLELERLLGLFLVGDLAGLGEERLEILDFPYLGGAVGAAGGQVLDVGGEEDAGDGAVVGFEVGEGDELGFLAELEEVPDVDVALGVS